MINNEGIVEVIGHKGTGKTTFVCSMIKNRPSVIYSSKKFPIKIIINQNDSEIDKISPSNITSILKNLHIKNVNTFQELSFSVIYQLELFIFLNAIEIIIIDTLDSLLASRKGSDYHKDVYCLVNKLKYFGFKYNIKIYILNELGVNKSYTNFCLGKSWEYIINKRIILEKNGRKRKMIINTMYINEEEYFYFDIIDSKFSIDT